MPQPAAASTASVPHPRPPTQALTVLACLLAIDHGVPSSVLAAALALLLGGCFYAVPMLAALAARLPQWSIGAAQAAASATMVVGLLPQIRRNFARRTGGGWSPITAALAASGCAARIFTTLTLAGADKVMLAGYASGLATNGVLLAQTIIYGEPGAAPAAAQAAAQTVPQ